MNIKRLLVLGLATLTLTACGGSSAGPEMSEQDFNSRAAEGVKENNFSEAELTASYLQKSNGKTDFDYKNMKAKFTLQDGQWQLVEKDERMTGQIDYSSLILFTIDRYKSFVSSLQSEMPGASARFYGSETGGYECDVKGEMNTVYSSGVNMKTVADAKLTWNAEGLCTSYYEKDISNASYQGQNAQVVVETNVAIAYK